MFRNQKEFLGVFRLPRGDSLVLPVRRKDTSIPTHALLQYRTAAGPRFDVYGEAGAGAMSFAEKLKLLAPTETNFLARHQNSSPTSWAAESPTPGSGTWR